MSERLSESLDAIIVEKNTGLSARLNIDLSDYVQSYDRYMSVKERPVLGELDSMKLETIKTVQKKYEAEHAKVTSELSAAVSDMLWTQLFNTAIQDLSLTQREDIIASPAYIILKKNFRDIMKNSVDKAIQRHHAC